MVRQIKRWVKCWTRHPKIDAQVEQLCKNTAKVQASTFEIAALLSSRDVSVTIADPISEANASNEDL